MRDDKVLGSTVRIDCTTHDSTGALVAPSSAFSTSDFRIYKDGSATEKTSTNGITVTSPFDSIVGKHLIEIDTSNSTGDSGFWAAGSEYRVEINSAKTVSSIVQSGVVIGRFALVAAGVLRPTTDGRTLDVSAAGNAGIDWSNVEAPTTTVAFTGTTISTSQVAASVTGAVGSVSGAVGSVTGSVGSVVGAVVLDSAAILAVADQVWDEAMSGHTTAGTYGGRIVRATNSNTEVQITGSNHIAADIHDLQSGVISAGDFAANSITASALATDAVTEIQSGLARTGANSDTLETLSDQLDTIAANVSSVASVSREAY